MDLKEQQEPDLTAQSQPEMGAGRPSYPSFVDLAAIYGVFILSQFLGLLLAKIILPLTSIALSAELEMAWDMLICQVISMPLLLLFIFFLRRRRGSQRVHLKFGVSGFDPTTLLAGFVMMLTTTVVIEPLLALLPAVPELTARGWPLLVSAVVLAPIFEEIICRGVIFEALRTKYGLFLAMIISSLLFGLMHIPAPAMVLNAFFMGLILCYFYISSRSLIAPIILHMLNNGLAYVFILLGWGGNVILRDVVANTTAYTIIYICSALILIAATIICVRNFKKIVARNEVAREASEQNNIEQSEES